MPMFRLAHILYLQLEQPVLQVRRNNPTLRSQHNYQNKTALTVCHFTTASTAKAVTDKWRNDTDSGNPKYSEKNLSQCHSSATNPTRDGLRLTPGLSGDSPATGSLSHGTGGQYVIGQLVT